MLVINHATQKDQERCLQCHIYFTFGWVALATGRQNVLWYR